MARTTTQDTQALHGRMTRLMEVISATLQEDDPVTRSWGGVSMQHISIPDLADVWSGWGLTLEAVEDTLDSIDWQLGVLSAKGLLNSENSHAVCLSATQRTLSELVMQAHTFSGLMKRSGIDRDFCDDLSAWIVYRVLCGELEEIEVSSETGPAWCWIPTADGGIPGDDVDFDTRESGTRAFAALDPIAIWASHRIDEHDAGEPLRLDTRCEVQLIAVTCGFDFDGHVVETAREEIMRKAFSISDDLAAQTLVKHMFAAD